MEMKNLSGWFLVSRCVIFVWVSLDKYILYVNMYLHKYIRL